MDRDLTSATQSSFTNGGESSPLGAPPRSRQALTASVMADSINQNCSGRWRIENVGRIGRTQEGCRTQPVPKGDPNSNI